MSQPPTTLDKPQPTLTPPERRRIAVAAGCHPDCIVDYERGNPMRSTTLDRIERALRNADLSRLIDARRRFAK